MKQEKRIYVDFDRYPRPIITEDDPLKRLDENDIEQVQKWAKDHVSNADNVYAIITGRASKYLFVVAACALSTCGNVQKIGCAPTGMLAQVAMDFGGSEN